MAGLWTCARCELRLGLDTAGQASAPAGYCAAGDHRVRETIRYAPRGRRLVKVATPTVGTSVVQERFTERAGQWDMF